MNVENYTDVINLLYERCGNIQVQFKKHVKNFVGLPSVKSRNDISCLRNLIDKLDGSVPNLKRLKVDQSMVYFYGNFTWYTSGTASKRKVVY